MADNNGVFSPISGLLRVYPYPPVRVRVGSGNKLTDTGTPVFYP